MSTRKWAGWCTETTRFQLQTVHNFSYIFICFVRFDVPLSFAPSNRISPVAIPNAKCMRHAFVSTWLAIFYGGVLFLFVRSLVLFISRTVFLHSVPFYCNAGPIKKKRFYVTVALFHHVFVSCNITFYTIDPNESEQKRACVRGNAYVSIVNMTLAFVNFMRFLYISLCQAIATLYNVHAFDGLLFSHTSSLLIAILFIFNESMLCNPGLFMSHFLVFILHIFQPPTNNGIFSGDVLTFR